MRCRVYIDGFNLYYGCLKGSPYKWLNLWQLCQTLLPTDHELAYMKYFTAKVKRTDDDPGKPNRQDMLLRALATLPACKIILGSFQSHPVMRPLVRPVAGQPTHVRVIDTKEKGSDVNLATHLVSDAYKDLFDVAVLVTNDSDLVTPIRFVREETHKKVGILNPHRKQSVELKQYANYCLPVTEAALKASQFPDIMTDLHGQFHKPPGW